MSCMTVTDFLAWSPKVYAINHQTLYDQINNKKTIKEATRAVKQKYVAMIMLIRFPSVLNVYLISDCVVDRHLCYYRHYMQVVVL